MTKTTNINNTQPTNKISQLYCEIIIEIFGVLHIMSAQSVEIVLIECKFVQFICELKLMILLFSNIIRFIYIAREILNMHPV